MTTIKRADLILWALQRLRERVPYIWGGKDPTSGLDCSGFITAGLWQCSFGKVDLRGSHNTDRLWLELPRVTEGSEAAGDVACYRGERSTGPDDIEHVMLVIHPGVVVGQAFGGRANTNKLESIAKGHVTHALKSHYRHDLCGFLRLPLLP